MICPRCSVAEIAESGHCALCGFSPAASVILQESVVNEVQEVVQRVTADRFLIHSLLRLGERSLVFLAHEVAHDRQVALKVIPAREGVSQTLAHRFERQAASCQALRQAHIVALHSFGSAATFLWYTMDLMKGQSLGDVLRESGPMSLDLCLNIADQIATALDYAHRRGVPHGNLKPSNVFLDDRWVRVADFAILEAFGRQPASGTGPWLRLPEYMAPEQFYARAPAAGADQYALAVMIYQCLSGALPFIGDSFEEVARQQAQNPPIPLTETRKDIPVPVSEAVNRALSKQPAQRFPSVLDFVTALAAGQALPARRSPSRGRPGTPARRATPGPVVLVVEPEKPSRRRRWEPRALGAVGPAGVIVLLVLAGWWLGLIRLGGVTQSAPVQEAPPEPAAPSSGPAPAQADPALVRLDRLTDAVLDAVRVYGDRRARFRGPENCAALAQALVAVEGHWIAYNARGKPHDLALDDPRAARDQSLYAVVGTVETHFDQTVCPRP
jgi:serine/threonine-protein kinase